MTPAVKEGVRAIGFMALLSAVLITCVAALSLATAERVERNANLFLQQAVMEVAGQTVPADPAAVAAWYAGAVTEDPAAPGRFLVRDAPGGAVRTVVYRRQARGLWGLITAVVGVNPATGAFRQLRILDQNETPGLGARITEPWFLAQSDGRRGPFRLVPEGTRSTRTDELDAITGATVTSAAIRDMLNGVVRDLPRPSEEPAP
ncbi:MAG TPA: FMN-binding protein [Kiritimatiellia bacterium]|nr:MAG: Na(+)-translocating NADH-quinone reductase subunit C [Verrucomicrobia bacterium ADurb.Bin070]HPB10171.1 FMN-binding protein [Kiritimatiellia bacterium]HQA37523.1 FMN-binding protein [Kiritimatiellia bacterium]HQQ91032.1 FMN-binding protein [Kiritimatiellia bacterium]